MLELKNITKKFGDKVIFDGFDLTIKSGEVVAIAGPSGGGKTTLLRMLAGLETIDAGQVIFDGETVELNDLITRNLLGFVFQDFQLFPHMTVLENLVLSPMKTMQVSKDIAIAKAEELLKTQRGLGTFLSHNSYDPEGELAGLLGRAVNSVNTMKGRPTEDMEEI